MHTLVPFFRFKPSRRASCTALGAVGAALMMGLSILLVSPAWGQASFPGAPNELGGNVRVYPLDLWSPRVGVGAGAGLVVHNLGRSESQTLLTVAPARYEQVATLSFASANPRRAQQYVLFDAKGLHTDRQWFYGFGPTTDDDARTTIERSSVRLRLRGGHALMDRHVLFHPHIELILNRVDDVPAPSGTSLDARSQTHLQQISGETGPLGPRQTGLRLGMDGQYDTRDDTFWPTRGGLLQASWSRYIDVGSSFVHFDQMDVDAYRYVPLGGRHRIVGHLSATVTRSRSASSVPFYMLPTLDGQLVPGWARSRFVASDRLIASTLYRFPLANVRNLLQLEGHVGLHAANVYDDLFSDAGLDVSFDRSLSEDASPIPLRPAVSTGIRLGLPFRHLSVLDLAVGVSPEGVSAVRFTFQRSLQALRRPHHSSSPDR